MSVQDIDNAKLPINYANLSACVDNDSTDGCQYAAV
jgi:hypothetical protein